MSQNFFVKRAIKYFSFYLLVILLLNSIFFTFKSNSLVNKYSKVSQEELEANLSLLNDALKSEITRGFSEITRANSAILDYILGTEYIIDDLLAGREMSINKLLNLNNTYDLTRQVMIEELGDNKVEEKYYERKDDVLILGSSEVIDKLGSKYIVKVEVEVNLSMIVKREELFLDNIGLISRDSKEGKGLYEVFNQDLDKEYIVSVDGKPYEYFRVYLPLHNNDTTAMIVYYDLNLSEYKNLTSKLTEENKTFLSSVKKDLFFMLLVLYFLAFFVQRYIILALYEPMKEVIVAIEEMSAGKFGRKVKLTGRKPSRDLAKKINRLSSNLSFINRLKQTFLLKKSYEFKNIVDSIVSLSEATLKNNELDILEKKNIELINENAQQLLGVVKGLNEYYLLADSEDGIRETVNIKRLVDEVFVILNGTLKEKKIKLINNVPIDESYVVGDSIKLYVIFSHLIGNAIRYSQEGEVKVHGSFRGGHLNIEISDTGMGIRKEKLKELKAFLLGDLDDTQSGLGLSLSKRIVEHHGGSLEIDSEEGIGTIVSFSLRGEEKKEGLGVEKIAELKERLKGGISRKNSKKRYKILLYCDNALNIQLIVNYLFTSRYIIELTDNEDELIEKLGKSEYDLLIVDLFGAWSQEYQIIRDIRAYRNKTELPILLVNNRNRGEDVQEAFHLGVNELINKPLYRDEFLAKIETQLKLKRTLSSMERVNQNYMKEKQERILAENLREFHTELTSTLNVKKIFLILFRKIRYLFDYDSALVLLKKEDKYQVIFQEGQLDKREKTDTLFKSRYLDPIIETGRIIVINEYKCRKYFSNRVKSAIAIPLKYKKNENCVIIIKSTLPMFFKELSKETIDALFYQSSIAIKNANLYGELEKKNIRLNMLIEKIKIIDKLISVIYNEKDKSSAIYYLLLVLVGNKMKLNYKEAYYFDYDKDEATLRCSNYHYNINKYTDDREKKITEKELWAKGLEISLEADNILVEAFVEGRSMYNSQVLDPKLKGKINNVTILPIQYEGNKFGIIVLESDSKKKEVDEHEKESLSIFAANLGIYLQTKNLEEESIKYHKSRTLNTFAKSIVHELRTPLVGIKGFAAMTKEKYASDKKLAFYMSNIINDAERVIDLSSQIVDFVEEENAKYAFKNESITRGIIEVVREFEDEMELSNVKVEVFEDEFFIPYDKVKLKKVFRHIIKNTMENIDYNKESHSLTIAKEEYKDKIIISFEDNGVGIEQEMLKEAFNPLVSSKLQGTGLGLTLSKNIVEKHGFDMAIESKQGEFTKVSIIIT